MYLGPSYSARLHLGPSESMLESKAAASRLRLIYVITYIRVCAAGTYISLMRDPAGTSTADPRWMRGGCVRRARALGPAPPRLRGRGRRPSCSWLRPLRREPPPPSRRTRVRASPGRAALPRLLAPCCVVLRRIAPCCDLLRFIAIVATNGAVYCALLQVSSSRSPVRALDTLDLPGRAGRADGRRRRRSWRRRAGGWRRGRGSWRGSDGSSGGCSAGRALLRRIAPYCYLLRFIATYCD